jgi:nucleoid-associated protein YgaU
MARTGTVVVPVLVLLAGCQKQNQQLEAYQPLPGDEIAYDPSVVDFDASAEQAWGAVPSDEPETAVAVDMFVEEQQLASGSRTHVVRPKDTLYGLARLYYNDHRQWKRIYEANADQITDPNKIRIGMELMVP